MVSGLLIAGTVFCFWGVASSFHVQSLRLAESTIPHIIAAKTILGESGRVIMGLVIISGTGAAVNALLVSVGELVTDVSRREFLPFFLRKFLSRSSTTMILLALATAAMMALGAAGTEALYTCIRGSIILWMLNYAVVHFAMLLPGALPASRARNDKLKRIVSHGSVFFLMVVGSVILIATDDNTGLLIRYFVIVFLGVGLTVWLGRRIQSRRWRDGKKLQSID
jgi:amino acid transporter